MTADSSLAESLARVDEICDAFESQWKQNQRPQLEAFLNDVPASMQHRLVGELLKIDVEYRRRAGEQPALADYLPRLPDFDGPIKSFFQSGSADAPVTEPHLTALEHSHDATTPPNQQPLRSCGDYDLLEEIGCGGMGVVYRAVQRPSNREVAVKIIRPAGAATVDAMQLFLREARTLSKLRHPQIVEYLSLGLHEGQMYLAMEYLPTVDFSALLATQSRPKQVRLACASMCRVLEALQHAHERNVVHRDVKPSNILFYKSNRRLFVKLADFGLAKNYESAGFTSISCEMNVRGTLGYMAPEQLIESRYAKPPCDVYSAGACLYYFLSGKRPNECNDSGSVVAQILNSRSQPLAELTPDVPVALAQAVDRSLAREPGDRFGSAEEMRNAILKFTEK